MNPFKEEVLRSWNYTVKAGDTLQDEWLLSDFADGKYHLRVYGPNGFFREFEGDQKDPALGIICSYEKDAKNPLKLSGNVIFTVTNQAANAKELVFSDESYKTGSKTLKVPAKGKSSIVFDLGKNYNWYDISLNISGNAGFKQRFSGRVETGSVTKTDPLMGRLI